MNQSNSKQEQIKKRDKEYVANTYSRYDVVIEKGKGALCYDYDGKEYVDFSSGIGVNSLGFSDAEWINVVSNQLAKIQHTSNLFYTEPCGLVAEEMCKRTGMKKMFFSNSGAEANEGAIKAARKYSLKKYGEGRHEIISLTNSFHGRTMATLSAAGQDSLHDGFMPLLEGFKYVEANNVDALNEAISNKTCAIILELIQGEGGVNVLQEGYVEAVYEICKSNDILLIIDEIQTGIGRTGKFMATDHYNIKADIMTVAKGLGGGLPVGGILFGEKTESALSFGEHGSTFGGNPVVCAGAHHILGRIDDAFLNTVEVNSKYLRDRLLEFDEVEDVSGLGLMVGITLKSGKASDVAKKCVENGLLIVTAKDKLRLLPPLVITKEEIDKGLQILQLAIK